MSKDEIYEALSPSWWVASMANNWQTIFYSTVITFEAGGTPDATYTSSAPLQTGGLNAGTDAPVDQVGSFIDSLRLEAAQRLFDMNCKDVTGHKELSSVFNATG